MLLFVRAYDEAHHSKDYPIVTPEGDFGGTMTNDDGSPQKVAWGSFSEISKKALAALDTNDPAALSALLGAKLQGAVVLQQHHQSQQPVRRRLR